MHHTGDTDGTDGGQLLAEFCFHIGYQPCKANLNTSTDFIHAIGPDPIDQLVFPVIAAGGDRKVVFIQQNGFDACGS